MIRVHRCVRYDEKTVVVEQKHSSHFIERTGRFLIAEEHLRIETSYPFNKVTAVFLLDNYCLIILYNCYSRDPLCDLILTLLPCLQVC